MQSTALTGRRTFLKTAVGVSVTGSLLAGCAGMETSSSNDSSSNNADAPSFNGWLDNTANYNGVTDKTAASEITVKVGANGSNGPYAFTPVAIKVKKGTAIVWKWTGKGGAHNVVSQNGRFESKLVAKKGHTFKHAFDSSGTYKYLCEPHRSMGMKGVVVVK